MFLADTERRAPDPGDCAHAQLDPNAHSPGCAARQAPQ